MISMIGKRAHRMKLERELSISALDLRVAGAFGELEYVVVVAPVAAKARMHFQQGVRLVSAVCTCIEGPPLTPV